MLILFADDLRTDDAGVQAARRGLVETRIGADLGRDQGTRARRVGPGEVGVHIALQAFAQRAFGGVVERSIKREEGKREKCRQHDAGRGE